METPPRKAGPYVCPFSVHALGALNPTAGAASRSRFAQFARLHVGQRDELPRVGLQPMCGEEGVTCSPEMPKFDVFYPQGSPATKEQPGNGTHLEDKTIWALEASLDVETAHAIAPGANILLVATTGAETLGVQGFPEMMNAEQFLVDHHLANVISQSFSSAEDAFASGQSLEILRHAFRAAAQNGVTALAS